MMPKILMSTFLPSVMLLSMNSYADTSDGNLSDSTVKMELSNLLIDSFAIPLFLNNVKVSSTLSDKWKTCSTSNETLQNVRIALSKEVDKNIQPLNKLELYEYFNLFKNGGSSALFKYSQSNYQDALHLHQGKKVSIQNSTKKLLSSFNEQERSAWAKFDSLPNQQVREMITPNANPDRELFRTMAFGMTMRWAIEDSCQKFTNSNVANGK